MAPRRPVHSPRRLGVLVAVTLLAACGGAASDPPTVPDRPTSADRAVRVAASIDDPRDAGVRAFEMEIVRTPEGVHARAETPAGLFAEELSIADRYFVRVPDAEVVLGTDRWIRIDRGDKREADALRLVEIGMLPLAGVDELVVGDEVFNEMVRSIDHDGHRWTLTLDGGTEVDVTVTDLDPVPELPVPGPSDQVSITEVWAQVWSE